MSNNKNRLEYIDGLRGLAALLVLLFHTYSWNNRALAFGDSFTNFPLFQSGWLGAELFFMISGFVILISLENSKDFITFFKKRILRIYPAFFISCIILLFVYIFFREGRVGNIAPYYSLYDILSSFTLTDNYLWNILMKYTQQDIYVSGINASFWTIFVELKFYILFGLAYYRFGSK